MGDLVRIGKISTIDYKRGMASIVYTDRNDESSPSFPFLSTIYEMPKVDDTVLVLFLPNSTKGFILGVPYSEKITPSESGQGIFYKQFSDGAFVFYDPKTKTMEMSGENIILKCVTASSIKAKTLIVESGEFEKLTVGEIITKES